MGLAATVSDVTVDFLRFLKAAVGSKSSLVAGNLFLRKQLAFYQEHEVRPRRLTDGARIALVFWSRWLDWKEQRNREPDRDVGATTTSRSNS